MKMERNMDCRNIRRAIEEADHRESVSAAVSGHLTGCRPCETFYADQSKLRQIVSDLGTVSVPNDFEFRLRARLASEKRGASQPFRLAGGSFGLKSAALAALLLMIGSAAVILSLRPATDPSVAAVPGSAPDISSRQSNGAALTAPTVANTDGGSTPTVAVNSRGSSDRNATARGTGANRHGRAGNQLAAAGSRIKTRDMASTAAKTLRPEDLVAGAGHSVFPIDASTEPIRVSLDNGRGAAKTISVPGVSFGSQRALNQNPLPLMASSRGAW